MATKIVQKFAKNGKKLLLLLKNPHGFLVGLAKKPCLSTRGESKMPKTLSTWFIDGPKDGASGKDTRWISDQYQNRNMVPDSLFLSYF